MMAWPCWRIPAGEGASTDTSPPGREGREVAHAPAAIEPSGVPHPRSEVLSEARREELAKPESSGECSCCSCRSSCREVTGPRGDWLGPAAGGLRLGAGSDLTEGGRSGERASESPHPAPGTAAPCRTMPLPGTGAAAGRRGAVTISTTRHADLPGSPSLASGRASPGAAGNHSPGSATPATRCCQCTRAMVLLDPGPPAAGAALHTLRPYTPSGRRSTHLRRGNQAESPQRSRRQAHQRRH